MRVLRQRAKCGLLSLRVWRVLIPIPKDRDRASFCYNEMFGVQSHCDPV